MILLTSDGITSPQLEEKIREELPWVTGRAALVTTASCQLKERDDNVPVLSDIMGRMGLESCCFDVEFQDVAQLLAYDVVIFMGGNPFYLRKHLKKWRRCREILIQLANHHVLVGISAGSMVLGKTMEFVCSMDPDSVAEAGDHVDCEGFHIVPLNIMPHFKAYLTVYPGMDRLLDDYSAQTGNPIRTINDGEGIFIKQAGRKGRYIKNSRYTPRVSADSGKLDCDNYIFDIYGTLIDIHTEEGEDQLWGFMSRYFAYKGAEYEPGEMRYCYETMVREEESLVYQTLKKGQLPEPQVEIVFEKMYRRKGVEVSRQEAVDAAQIFRSISMKYIRLYYGVKPLLKHLRQLGKKLYVLSNAQQVFTEGELRYLGIYDYFDKVYLSSDFHCKKPDEEFFKKLLDEEGLDPEKTMMIGNNGYDDIATARALGLATCYIRSNLSDPREEPQSDIFMNAMDMPLLEEILCKE